MTVLICVLMATSVYGFYTKRPLSIFVMFLYLTVTLLTIITAGTAAISLILNFLLIPRFGAIGAAIATTASYGATILTVLLLFRKHVTKNIAGLFVPGRKDFAVYKDFYFSIVKR